MRGGVERRVAPNKKPRATRDRPGLIRRKGDWLEVVLEADDANVLADVFGTIRVVRTTAAEIGYVFAGINDDDELILGEQGPVLGQFEIQAEQTLTCEIPLT